MDISQLAHLPSTELIARFEQDFDLPMRHHVGLGLLEAKGAFSSECRREQPMVNLGAYWARILQSDVEYALMRGLEAIADSTELAAQLSEHPPADEFSRYVMARWHDAVGRIQFRCGDMMAARLAFQQAANHAQHDQLWYCRPDIQSNLLRSQFDEREKAGENRNLAQELEKFAQLLVASLELVKSRGIELDFELLGARLDDAIDSDQNIAHRDLDALAAILGTRDAQELRQRGELLRGVSNVLHNLSIVQAPDRRRAWDGDRERALDLARQSAALASLLGDEYRLAQALRHRAALIGTDGEHAALAMKWLLVVRDRLSWRRGRWIATQAIARSSPPQQAAAMLEALLVELESHKREYGADAGFDVDVYRYTLGALEDVIRVHGLPAMPHNLHARRLDVAASVRRVVKVATYRSRFAQVVYPIYLGEIEQDRRAAAQRPDEVEIHEDLCAKIEETSARDLLDTLMVAHDTAPDDDSNDQPLPAREAAVVHASGRSRSMAARSSGLSEAYAAIGEARHRFEARALRHPISSTTHDSEIAISLRRLTSAQPGLAVVRYFGSDWDARSQRARTLHALVVRLGNIAVIELRSEAIWQLVSSARPIEPSAELAAAIGRLLIEPVWQTITAASQPIEQLVLIPAAGMFSLPLHVATLADAPTLPLCVRVPLSFSVSATAFVTHRRYLLRTQPRDETDDLCALVPGDTDIYPGELEGVGWAPDNFHLAGSRPAGLAPEKFTYWGPGDLSGLRRLFALRSEYFVFAGHGVSVDVGNDVDVALKLANGDFLTQYDLAGGLRIKRNKLTILGACVSGLGGNTGSGEVAGFIRSFIAAGAGALAVTLWPVEDQIMAAVVGGLLRRLAATKNTPFDVVATLHELHETSFFGERGDDTSKRTLTAECETDYDPLLRRCPIVLYL